MFSTYFFCCALAESRLWADGTPRIDLKEIPNSTAHHVNRTQRQVKLHICKLQQQQRLQQLLQQQQL